MADGVELGKRDELVGGGLKRHLKLTGASGFEAFDERVLGSGEFVELVLKTFTVFSEHPWVTG